jgi:hypothetical protein
MRRMPLRHLAIPSLAVVLVAATSGPASAALVTSLPRVLPNAQQSVLSPAEV